MTDPRHPLRMCYAAHIDDPIGQLSHTGVWTTDWWDHVDSYETGKPDHCTGDDLDNVDRMTLHLDDGRQVTCQVSHQPGFNPDPEYCVQFCNRVTFLLGDTVLGMIQVNAADGTTCHQVKFRFAGGVPFASNIHEDHDINTLSTLPSIFPVQCRQVLEAIASELTAGSRFVANEGRLSMVNNLGDEVWAITTDVDDRCLPECGNCIVNCAGSYYNYYMDALVIVHAGLEQTCVLQRVPTDLDPEFREQLEIMYAEIFEGRTQQLAASSWSPLRALFAGAVVRAAASSCVEP